MHRQPSRNTANIDAIDCIVTTNDLALENEVINQEHEQRRESNSSRRDQPSKRSNENFVHRSTRHSSPAVTRKHHSSPHSLSSRSQHHHYPPQKHHRVSSPSPSPPPPSSTSRHHRSTRPIPSIKRPHSHSRSPYDRRAPTNRSRPQSSKERTIDNVPMSISRTDEQIISKKPYKISPNQETGDLSLVSEDESTKINDIRSNGTTTNESSSKTSNNKLHSTPSLPILQPNANDSILEMSNIAQDCELSLFAKSTLSPMNTNSILTTPILPTNDLMQTIDLISKYKMMQSVPCNNPQVEACSKEILIIIQKQIEIQKREIEHREREIKLRERELAEREKRFIERSNDTTNTASVNIEPVVVTKSIITEEKPQQQSEIIQDQQMNNVSQEESVTNSIPSTVDTSKVTLTNKNGDDQAPFIRKNGGKSRFSKVIVDPSIFGSRQNSVVNLYSDDNDDDQSSSSINTNNSLKKAIISKILAPSEPTVSSIVDTELKVTSSNSCRKVEFQSGAADKTTSKGSSHDLRLILSKNRTKQQSNDEGDDDVGTIGDQMINDDEQTITINKTVSSKLNSNKEEKQQSHDYQKQRSVTSTSIETIVDNTNDKRDNRRHEQPRTNSSRQHQYSGQNPSSATINSNERSYTRGSTSQQQSKYGSNQKRQDNDDLRSRLFEHKQPKSSRPTHRNNY